MAEFYAKNFSRAGISGAHLHHGHCHIGMGRPATDDEVLKLQDGLVVEDWTSGLGGSDVDKVWKAALIGY